MASCQNMQEEDGKDKAMINEEMQLLGHIEEAYSVAKALGDMNARHMRRTLSRIHDRLEQDPRTGRLSLWKEDAPSREELVLGGQMVNKNLQMSKVAMIAKEIGQQPVLCFGNSSGDISMAKFVTTNNPHLTRVFMLCCDDTVRENGNLKKAEKMQTLCEENGWVSVSMKNDWETIYGPGVTRKQIS